MSKNSYRKLFIKTKGYYKSIVKMKCKAFGHEEIHFSRRGFEHMIRKEGKLRPIPDQIRRFKLFNRYIASSMENATRYEHETIENFIERKEYKKKVTKKVNITFYTILEKIENKLLKIIIEQEGNGKKHFLSIMAIDN